MTTTPRVSIGVPVYNGGRYLQETLDSLTALTGPDLEIVVSDNGSTDSTEELCRAAAAADERIRYHRSPENRGAAWNYNRVLELATAPLFKWAAADDLCEPTFVARCVELLDAAGPAAVLAYPRTTLIDESSAVAGELDDDDLDLRARRPSDRIGQLLRHRVEWHPVFGVVRTDVLRRTPGIGAYPSADISLLAELSLYGQFHQVPERLFLRRYHDERSIAAGPSFKEQVAWYNPKARAKLVLPQVKLTKELLAGVRRVPLQPGEKARAARMVLQRWALPHWRHIGGELKLAARDLARR
ncbi:glycosyltransferase family 2 protein [Jiangella mangrovi]|uniref:Glycosyltransferase involved in cell wall biosynthesis n=1 Tax=Jiangella mangrovi TaxID=1524084 RepID=A0A7W9LJN6_9ACTN|nr:glycosyltransferase family 2 protein [Jiangella mangrovi]MBB5786222.1 glycosyltransferase involved in cell wall biosynthesis [Jiangella mangrovi]